MSANDFDVVVIGGGPGGYVAAIRAAQLGKKVCVIERDKMGGVCLNWGCIPTKALLRSSEVFNLIKHSEEFGISVKDVKVDLKKMVERSRKVSSQLSSGIDSLMKKHKVTVKHGSASFSGSKKLSVTLSDGKKEEVTGKNFIIATGARPRVLPGFEPDGKLVITSKEAMIPEKLPKKLLVVGSGAIGIEFASFYSTIGSEVTVAEVQTRILPVEDEEISKFAHKAFEKQGIKILTSTNVKAITKAKDHVVAKIEHDGKAEDHKFDQVIMAVGITANTDGIGLESTKVKLDRGHILTNGYMQTEEPHIYAIGDVTGAPWLAHKASHEGVIAAEHIAGMKVHPMDKTNIPGCTYSHPQIASVGLTEAKAKELHKDIKVGKFPFIGNGKAIALGEPEGLVKVIFDAKTGELLGAHMIGAEVTEMIQGYVVSRTLEATELDLMHTVFPHPTLSEMMHEAVLGAYARAIHI